MPGVCHTILYRADVMGHARDGHVAEGIKEQAAALFKHPHAQDSLEIGFYFLKSNFLHSENKNYGVNQQSIYHTRLHNKILSG